MRERHRSLLADLNEGVVRPEEARARRNALLEELRRIRESAPPGSVRGIDDVAGTARGAIRPVLVPSAEH